MAADDSSATRTPGSSFELRREWLRHRLTAASPTDTAQLDTLLRDVDSLLARGAREATNALRLAYDDERRVGEIAALREVQTAQASALTNRNVALGAGLAALMAVVGGLLAVQRRRRALAVSNGELARANADVTTLKGRLPLCPRERG